MYLYVYLFIKDEDKINKIEFGLYKQNFIIFRVEIEDIKIRNE
jgi:hypothetical protein